MRINSVRNLSFGKIYITESFKYRVGEVFERLCKEPPEYDKMIDYIKYN